MSDYVTHEELDAAIAAVKQDIRDTEARLADRIGPRFDRLETRVDQTYYWTVFGLFGIIAAIIGAVVLLHK